MTSVSLFIHRLFKADISTAEAMQSGVRSEYYKWSVSKYLNGGDAGLSRQNQEIPLTRVSSSQAEIRIGYLPNTGFEGYRYSNLIGERNT
jgi:hypothetical protein